MDALANDANFLENEFGTEWENDMFDTLDKVEEKYASHSSKESEPEDPTQQHLEVLKRSFGHKCFRPLQWKIINSIMNQKRDNCAIMTTGYGKSICFQYPSVYIGGITLIISPLISLMEDQVLAMKIANIPACLLGTANTNNRETLTAIEDNKYSLVYLTPEYCTGDFGSKLLKNWYQKLSITLIAIDEAHCVSIWGHDFRFKYRKLGFLRDIMPTVPILAVTATATEKIRKDIISTLRLKDPQVLTSSLDRPNFYFAVNLKSADFRQDLRSVLEHQKGWKFSGPTIIYCLTRKETEDINFILTEMGLNCMFYHAGLPMSTRKKVHEKFVKDKIDIVVATIAFGMGIDKPDVRNVIHYGISSSIEAYYQEAGRAGRDGLPAKCVVFYDDSDFIIHEFLMRSSSESRKEKKNKMMESVKEYINTRKCRRRFILNYLEETNLSLPERPDCCDNCLKNTTNPDDEIYEGFDDNGEDNKEIMFEKEARVKLYNMLLKKRLELAGVENCMPYMIASNKALMDMAEMKPTTLKEIANFHFDGLTATKLEKYGEAFMNMIKEMTVQQKKTIEEVLILHPMPEISNLSPSAMKSYYLLKSGKSVNEMTLEEKNVKIEKKDIKVEELTEDEKLSQFIRDLEECDESYFSDDEKSELSPPRKTEVPCQSSSYREEDVKGLGSFSDDDLAALCDDLETSIECTRGTCSESILVIDSDDDEPSVKRSKRNIDSGFSQILQKSQYQRYSSTIKLWLSEKVPSGLW